MRKVGTGGHEMIIRVQGLETMKTTSPIIGEPQRQRARPEGRTDPKDEPEGKAKPKLSETA